MTLKILVVLIASLTLFFCLGADDWWNHTAYEWCKYQLCLQKKNWHEARAACEVEKKTLVQISDAAHYSYIRNLISSSISLLAASRTPTIDSELWIGLFVDTEGKQRWSNCEPHENENNSFPITYANSGCYVLNTTSVGITATDCNLEKQFLCKGTVMECFDGPIRNRSFQLTDYNHANTSISDQQFSAECSWSCTGYGSKDTSYIFYTPSASSSFISNDIYTKKLLYYEEIAITRAVFATDLCTKSGDASSWSDAVSSVVKETTIESVICPTLTSEVSLCVLNATNVSITFEELSAEIQKLRDHLIIKKDRLSSWKRKLVSAKDNRASAIGIGYVAVFVLAAVAFLVLALDSTRFISNIRHLKKQMKKKKQRTLSLPGKLKRRKFEFRDDTSC